MVRHLNTMNNPDLAGLLPSINLASRRPEMLRHILSFSRHYQDDILVYPEDKSKHGTGNDYMLVIGALCNLSLVEFYADTSGLYWGLNHLGHRIAILGSGIDHVEFIQRFPFSTEDIIGAKRKDWRMLKDPKHLSVLAEMIKHPCGVKERDFHSFGDERIVLETVASAISLGAGWASGYDFSPTLYGAFLAVSPNSPLNK